MIYSFAFLQTGQTGKWQSRTIDWLFIKVSFLFHRQCRLECGRVGRGTCDLTTRVVFLCLSDKTIKLWKVAERDKRPEGYNLKDEGGLVRDPSNITKLRVPVFQPMELMVEASPKRVFSNAHTYHINSISVNSDQETYLSADDLRINLWNLEITDQSFSILRTLLLVCVVLGGSK